MNNQVVCQKEEAKDKEQYNSKADNNCKQGNTSVPRDNKTMFQESEVLKTRLGWVVKKPDRLAYA